MTSTNPPPIAPACALFLDFDGTLAGLRDDPDAVRLSDEECETLCAAADRLGGALAVISGRAVEDLAARVPSEVWRLGGHGADVRAPHELAAASERQAPAALASAIDDLVRPIAGVRVETKGAVIAVHYRAAPGAEDHLSTALDAIVKDFADYRLQAGKMVFEAKPHWAHKGDAIKAMMEAPPFKGRTPVMAGDDRTDEDGFAVVQALGGYAVKVGEGPSAAKHRLASPQDVWDWLKMTERA